jgi:alpha-glucuronidase
LAGIALATAACSSGATTPPRSGSGESSLQNGGAAGSSNTGGNATGGAAGSGNGGSMGPAGGAGGNAGGRAGGSGGGTAGTTPSGSGGDTAPTGGLAGGNTAGSNAGGALAGAGGSQAGTSGTEPYPVPNPIPADEDGSQLWLRYVKVPIPGRLAEYQAALTHVIKAGSSDTLQAAQAELVKGISGLTGGTIPVADQPTGDGAVVLGTPASSTIVKSLSLADLAGVGAEGYVVQATTVGGKQAIVVAANTDVGVLRGSFALLRHLECHRPLQGLSVVSTPKIQRRILDHWDNLDGTIERGYAGKSLWAWSSLPGTISQRYKDYARANASLGINGVVLNNVNANSQILTSSYLDKVAALATAFRPYGITVYLSAQYGAPIQIGNLSTADPTSNAMVQVKNGPLDFQPREPFHPLFGGMPSTPVALELQITKEYLGEDTHLAYLGPLYEEVLKSDTYAKGQGSTVARIIDGTTFAHANTAIAGVANIGSDTNWTGSHFNQANWYVFGRMAWNPDVTAAEVAASTSWRTPRPRASSRSAIPSPTVAAPTPTRTIAGPTSSARDCTEIPRPPTSRS